jgi:uncharacterized membrane protein
MFLGLTPLGVVHTAISLVALAAGVRALVKYRVISTRNQAGRIYLVTTCLTAATGLFIFQHGGFGPPHALSILTLAALGAGAVASQSSVFGKWSRYVEAVCYTTTILFHLIPAFTETLTRLPLGNPVFPNAEAPQFGPIYTTLLVLFLAGLTLQLRWLRSQTGKPV